MGTDCAASEKFRLRLAISAAFASMSVLIAAVSSRCLAFRNAVSFAMDAKAVVDSRGVHAHAPGNADHEFPAEPVVASKPPDSWPFIPIVVLLVFGLLLTAAALPGDVPFVSLPAASSPRSRASNCC